MYYVTNYTESTPEQIAVHFETITKQAISAQIQKYTRRGDADMLEKIKKAKAILAAKRYEDQLLNGIGPNVHGVGIYTRGKYSYSEHRNGYSVWGGLFDRCYSKALQEKSKIYRGCSVDARFHKFQDFMGWAVMQHGFGVPDFQLDKDLLVLGNKVYGPDTCVFIPREVNLAIRKNCFYCGEYPIGVAWHKATGKFTARFRHKHIGIYDSPEEAHSVYKAAREGYVKSLAEKYKDQIDHRAYAALINYEVVTG